MKKTLITLATLSLLGCSSGTPDVEDVAPSIVEVWSQCNLVEVSDIEKVNGIDHGQSYELQLAYKIKLLIDVSFKNGFPEKYPEGYSCHMQLLNTLAQLAAQSGVGGPLPKGLVINMTYQANMVESENGWVEY